MRCTEADAFLHAYVDGELAGVDHDAYEQHLVDCDRCSRCSRLQARFKAAVRGHLPRPEVPDILRRRIETAIAAAPAPPRRWRWQLYPKLVPAFAAAAALAAIFVTTRERPSIAMQTAIRSFSAALPMDFVASSCALVSNWFHGKVDFPVRAPSESVGARCEGGRLMPLGERMGAYLLLRAPSGHKVAVLVWSGSEDEQFVDEPMQHLRNGLSVRMARASGTSGALFRSADGLNYAVTSDIDEPNFLNFLNTAFTR